MPLWHSLFFIFILSPFLFLSVPFQSVKGAREETRRGIGKSNFLHIFPPFFAVVDCGGVLLCVCVCSLLCNVFAFLSAAAAAAAVVTTTSQTFLGILHFYL